MHKQILEERKILEERTRDAKKGPLQTTAGGDDDPKDKRSRAVGGFGDRNKRDRNRKNFRGAPRRTRLDALSLLERLLRKIDLFDRGFRRADEDVLYLLIKNTVLFAVALVATWVFLQIVNWYVGYAWFSFGKIWLRGDLNPYRIALNVGGVLLAFGFAGGVVSGLFSKDDGDISAGIRSQRLSVKVLISTEAGLLEEMLYRGTLFYTKIVTATVLNIILLGFVGWIAIVLWKPVLSIMTLGMLNPLLNNLAPLWTFALWGKSKDFAKGHKYQGSVGVIFSLYFSLFMFWVFFGYGLLVCIVIHFLYDLIVLGVDHLVYSAKEAVSW